MMRDPARAKSFPSRVLTAMQIGFDGIRRRVVVSSLA